MLTPDCKNISNNLIKQIKIRTLIIRMFSIPLNFSTNEFDYHFIIIICCQLRVFYTCEVILDSISIFINYISCYSNHIHSGVAIFPSLFFKRQYFFKKFFEFISIFILGYFT